LDGCQVLLKLLLRPAVAQPIGLGNSVGVEILRRFVVVTVVAADAFAADRLVSGCLVADR
jgi:hypothetical protein